MILGLPMENSPLAFKFRREKRIYSANQNGYRRKISYLIASAQPMADVDWLLEKMERAGADTQCAATLEKAIQTRGIGRITAGEKASFSLSDGKRVDKVTEVVMGKGAVMRKLSFNHIP